MKDLQRSKFKPFNGLGLGYVVDQWLISLDKSFSIQVFDSNVKVRFAITHLELFGATWWNINEKKLGVDMVTVTQELFMENSCEHFLLEEQQQERANKFHNLRQYTITVPKYEPKFYELISYVGISNSLPLMVHHFNQTLITISLGVLRYFSQKPSRKWYIRLYWQSVTLGHGGSMGAPTTLGSKGNQNTCGNRKPHYPKGNQNQQK